MKCKNCGAKMPVDRIICDKCGASQTSEAADILLDRSGAEEDGYEPAGAENQGNFKKPLLLTLLVLLILAVIVIAVWFLVPAIQKSGLFGSKDAVSSQITAVVSSETASVDPQPEGEVIGEADGTRYLLQGQQILVAYQPETGESTTLLELKNPCVTAAAANGYLYYVEKREQYNYLCRVKTEAGAQPEQLRVNDKGDQLRTQMATLLAVNGKLFGFARYPAEEGNYVELYQLNADGMYSKADASTKILFTTQNVEAEKDRDISKYSVQVGDGAILIFYEEEQIQSCPVE